MSFNTKTVYITDTPTTYNPAEKDVVIQEKHFAIDGKEVVIITKDFSDTDLDKVKSELKNQGITIKFKGIKRNKSEEITAIKIDAKSAKSSVNYNTNSDEAIQPIKIAFHTDGSSISIGNGKVAHGKNYYTFNKKGNNTKAHSSGKGNHVYVYRDSKAHEHEEEHEYEVIEEHEHEVEHEHGEAHEIELIHEETHEEEHEGTFVYEVRSDDKGEEESEKIYFIRKSKDGKKVEEIIVNGKGNTWHSDDDNKKIEIIRSVKGNHFISTDDDLAKNSLIYLNGKEISYKEFKAMDYSKVESIDIQKGEDVIKKHGEKAKDGVMHIKSKK